MDFVPAENVGPPGVSLPFSGAEGAAWGSIKGVTTRSAQNDMVHIKSLRGGPNPENGARNVDLGLALPSPWPWPSLCPPTRFPFTIASPSPLPSPSPSPLLSPLKLKPFWLKPAMSNPINMWWVDMQPRGLLAVLCTREQVRRSRYSSGKQKLCYPPTYAQQKQCTTRALVADLAPFFRHASWLWIHVSVVPRSWMIIWRS